jgi:DnaK suppressor protein
MARREALLKLHKTLTNRSNELRKRLGMELNELKASAEGDAAETALGSEAVEIAGQLAVFEANELAQIERAIQRLKQGRYGQCEACDCKIPVSRLNDIPTADLCIDCQRQSEKDSSWLQDRRFERQRSEEYELVGD